MINATARTYRNAYSGLSRETWLLSLIMLINRSGTMVVPFLTLYLTRKIGLTVGQSGIVFGLFGFGAFCGAWLGGRLTDKLGFYPVQLITLTGGGIMFFLLGQMKTYQLICIFTWLLGFVNEAFRPANATAIASYSKEENRTRSYALNRLAINLGWALGSAAGGILASINYELLFWVDGATNIFAALLLLLLIKPAGKISLHQTNRPAAGKSAYSDTTYIIFVLVTMLFASCFFQMFNNLPLFYKEDLHLSETVIGIVMAANGLIIVLVEMVLIYKLEGRRKKITYISFGVFITGIAFWLLNIPGWPVMVASVMTLVVTMGEIFSLPFMNSYWTERSTSHNRGQYAALYAMSWSAAQTLGPMLGAQLAQEAGFAVLWWVVGGLCILAALLYSRLQK